MTTAITRIEEIVTEINSKLELIQSESVTVGLLLIEAKEELTESGLKYADFLEWCSSNFLIGKAQASKLMKVASVFSEDKRFSGVAMRVLYTLAVNATPEQMDRAADFAESGTLTTAVVNQLLNPKPLEQVKSQEEAAVIDTGETDSRVEDAVAQALSKVKEREVLEVDESVSQRETTEDNQELSAQIKELTSALSAANELIKSLQAEKVKHNTQSNAPYLPQFDSECNYAVLGLSEEDSKKITKVKKVFRELIKCGYGQGHKAFERLTAAKDALLVSIEENK